MIVCVCGNINESRIIRAIQAGLTFEDIQIDLGVCVRCACCRKQVEDLIKNYNENEANSFLD